MQRNLKIFSRTAAAWILALTMLAVGGARAQAATYTASTAQSDISGFDELTESGAGPVSVSSESSIGIPGSSSGVGKGEASASRGALAAFAAKRVDAGTIHGNIKSFARFSIDDLVFSLLPKSEFSPFNTFSTSLNYHVGGSMDLGGMNSSGLIEMDLGITGAGVSISQNGQFFAGHNLGDFEPIEEGEWSITRFGTLSSFAAAGGLQTAGGNTGTPTFFASDQLALTSPSFNLTFGSDGTARLTTAMTLAVTAGGGRFRGPIQSTTDFGHTLSFAISGPVFNLPDGITVNSIDGMIENNQWVGGPAGIPVPTPGTAAIGLAAFAMLALRRGPHRSSVE